MHFQTSKYSPSRKALSRVNFRSIPRPTPETIIGYLDKFTSQVIALPQGILLNNQSPGPAAKQVILLKYCMSCIDRYAKFLHNVERYYVKQREHLIDPRSGYLNQAIAKEIISDAYYYDEFKDRYYDLAEATKSLIDIIGSNPSHLANGANFKIIQAEIRASVSDMGSRTTRFSNTLERRLKFFELSRSLKEQSSVWVLTLLASFFIPMSLASSLLSMSTRLVDLHYLLYDFCGVIVLLSTIVFLVFLGLKVFVWSKEYFTTLEVSHPNFYRKFGKPVSLFVLYAVLLTFWALLMASFLYGMIKDVILGLKILGFGSAALFGILSITSGLLLAIILYM
jgi:hypothetical protein